jgi:hypothetical protein
MHDEKSESILLGAWFLIWLGIGEFHSGCLSISLSGHLGNGQGVYDWTTLKDARQQKLSHGQFSSFRRSKFRV